MLIRFSIIYKLNKARNLSRETQLTLWADISNRNKTMKFS